jgi:spore coat protein B
MNKEMVSTLLNKVVKIDRGGPESSIGLLLGAEDDHITVLTEKDGIVYYKNDHIKSITHATKDGMEFRILALPEGFDYIQGATFKAILESLKYQWIQINRGGPEKLEGVLDEINDDYITVILNNEVIRVVMFHIRNVSYGLRVELEEEPPEENAEAKKD